MIEIKLLKKSPEDMYIYVCICIMETTLYKRKIHYKSDRCELQNYFRLFTLQNYIKTYTDT